MRKSIKLVCLLLVLASLFATFIGCQNIFGSSTDIERVYGDWIYERSGGAGIRLSLNRNGIYYYEEFSSNDTVLYATSGKFSLSSTRLVLKDIDTDDDNRYSVYSISMKDSTEGEDILDLVPTLAKKYSFKRVGVAIANVVALNDATVPDIDETSSIALDIDGHWHSDSFGDVDVTGDTISVSLISGLAFDVKILSSDNGTLALSFPDNLIGTEDYKDVSYFIVNDILYVIFPSIGSNAIAFVR